MKKIILILLIFIIGLDLFAQPQYDGALERYNMKSDKAVREGLIGEYYSGMNFDKLAAVRQDKELYFDWDYSNPIPELGADYFSVRWRGKIYAEKEGKYIITAYTDDGMRIWLNGKIVINAWKDQPPTLYEARVLLDGDAFYDIRIDYYQERYQTTAAVFLNHEDDDRKPLNATNTIYGRNLEPSAARFDFWEEESLVDRFLVWVGAEEEKEPKPFVDQSFRPEPLAEQIAPIRQEEKTEDEAPVYRIESVKREESVIVEELPIRKTNVIENKYDDLKPGETLIVNNIYFDQGRAKLRPESFEELDRLYDALERHPQWKIKIDGHTDNVGYAALNLELSFDRARSVYFYLINKGIDKNRLQFEGFGSSRPLAKNDTEFNKQKNRRVEVTLNHELVYNPN